MKILNYFKRDAQRVKKIEAMFQVGNEVRCLKTHQVYKVVVAELGYVLLEAPNGQRKALDTWTPSGTLRVDVADRWDFLPKLVA